MKPYTKTKLFTLVLCLILIAVAFFTQLKGQSFLGGGCSYLDPILIDLLAFFAGLFLILEGWWRLSEHKNMSFKNQFTRSLRIAAGCAIVAIHILQFIYK